MDDNGNKGADTLIFPVSAGEFIDPNAFACGRCFCLILTTVPEQLTSYLYNMSFCLVPTPVVTSKTKLNGLAYNLHSAEGEGDGGAGYTILISPAADKYEIVTVNGGVLTPIIDISSYVDPHRGAIYPGGTAFCAETLRMWVAISTRNPNYDTLITVDLASNKVLFNQSIVKPALSSHFADCSTNAVGGLTQVAGAGGVSTIQLGMLTSEGSFNVLDAIDLPAGSDMVLSGVADFMHDPRWAASEYGAILYSRDHPLALPGLLFTSSAKKSGPAKLAPLGVVAAAVAVGY